MLAKYQAKTFRHLRALGVEVYFSGDEIEIRVRTVNTGASPTLTGHNIGLE